MQEHFAPVKGDSRSRVSPDNANQSGLKTFRQAGWYRGEPTFVPERAKVFIINTMDREQAYVNKFDTGI
jgi:hypothetical protein